MCELFRNSICTTTQQSQSQKINNLVDLALLLSAKTSS